MIIVVACPGCARQLRLPREVLDTTVRCPLCKATFTTTALDGDRAVGIPVRDDSPKPPSLSLDDDDAPVVPLEMPVLDALPARSDVSPYKVEGIDDPPEVEEPPRKPRKKRRREEEEEEQEVDARAERERRRRKAGDEAVRFAVFVHHDPQDRLDGKFQCEADNDGLILWRGKGRVLDVPLGAKCEYLGHGRLSLAVEGRDVELTAVHPDGLHDELARELVAYVQKRQDQFTLPERPRGRLPWLALVPLPIPLLALVFGKSIGGWLGFTLWGTFAALLAVSCYLIARQRHWTTEGRLWGTGLVSLAGYLALAVGFSVEGGDGPPPRTDLGPWRAYAPLDGGFRAEFPGQPGPHHPSKFFLPETLPTVHTAESPDAVFLVAHGDQAGNFQMDQAVRMAAEVLARNNGGVARGQVDRTLDGKKGIEFQFTTRDTSTAVARIYAVDRRVFVQAFVSKTLSPTGSEATKFLDSFAFDPSTGWPTNGRAGDPAVKPEVVAVKPEEPLDPAGRVVWKHTAPVVWAGFLPDRPRVVAVAEDGTVAVVDLVAGLQLGLVKVPVGGKVSSAALAADGRTLAVAGGSLHLIDVSRLPDLAAVALADRAAGAVAFSADGTRLAVGRGDGHVAIYDVARRQQTARVATGTPQVLSLAWPEARTLLVGDSAYAVRVFDPTSGQLRATLTGHVGQAGINPDAALPAVGLARDLRTLVSASNDRTARLWDVPTRGQKHALGHPDAVTAAAFFPSGRLVATGAADGGVRLWETATGKLRGPIRDTPGKVTIRGLTFSGDGDGLLVAAGDRVELWQVARKVAIGAADRQPLQPRPTINTRVEVGGTGGLGQDLGPIAVSRDRSTLAFLGRDGKFRVWDPRGMAARYEGNAGATTALALSPRGDLVAVGQSTTTILHAVRQRKPVGELAARTHLQIGAVAFSPDGSTVVSGHAGSILHDMAELHFWDVRTKALVRRAASGRHHVTAMSYLPDGLTLAVVGATEPDVRLFDAEAGREYARLKGSGEGLTAVAASPVSRFLATGNEAGKVQLWDMSALRQVFSFDGHAGRVNAVCYSGDGRTLASGGADRTVRLWDVGSGKLLHVIDTTTPVTGCAFAEVALTLFVRTNDGGLERWPLDLVEEMRQRPPRVPLSYSKAQLAEPPDLQPSGRIVAPVAFAAAPERGCALAVTRDRLLVRYAYPSWQPTHSVFLGEHVSSVALDPAKELLYAAVCPPGKLRHDETLGWVGDGGDLAVYDVRAVLAGKAVPPRLRPTATVKIGAVPRSLTLADGGRSLYYLSGRGPAGFAVERFDTVARKVVGSVESKGREWYRLTASPDGKTVCLLGRPAGEQRAGILAALDPATGTVQREVKLPGGPAYELSVDNALAVVTTGGGVFFVDPRTGDAGKPRPQMFVSQPYRSADGRTVYQVQWPTGDRVFACLLGDGKDGPPTVTTMLGDNGVRLAGPRSWRTPDMKFIVGSNGQVFRLAAAGIERPRRPERKPADPPGLVELPAWDGGHQGRVLTVALAPDGKTVLTGGENRNLLVRDAATGDVLHQLVPAALDAASGVYAVAFAPDGKTYAGVSWKGAGDAFALPGHGYRLGNRPGNVGLGLDAIAFLPDSCRLALAGEKGLLVWAVLRPAGVPEDRVIPSAGPLTGVAANPKTGVVAAGSVAGKVYLFDATEGKEVAALEGHADEGRAVAFSPDGKRLASAGVDGVVRVWDAAGRKEARKLDVAGTVPTAVAFTPDSRLVIAGALDGTVRGWNAETGAVVFATPPRPAMPVQGLAVSSDGKTLWAAAGMVLRRWDVSGLKP